jgi:hypothetical protein
MSAVRETRAGLWFTTTIDGTSAPTITKADIGFVDSSVIFFGDWSSYRILRAAPKPWKLNKHQYVR